MNDIDRNKSVSWIVTITIALLVTVLVGILFGFHVAKRALSKIDRTEGSRRGMGGTQNMAAPTVAYIQFNLPDHGTDVTCTQYVGGIPPLGGVLYARPDLSEGNGDTIRWKGAASTDVVTVTFQNSGPAGPFANTTYATPSPSSVPTAAGQGDFNFTSLTITRGATTYNCTNYQGMGVHVDQ